MTSASYKSDRFLGAILALAVFVAYLPVWHAGFIWDDDVYVTNNPMIIGPLGLKEIWASSTTGGMYCPLVLTVFRVVHALWGLAPLPYHLVTVFMHALCAILLWMVLRSLRIPGAWLGAALWALHPVQVEAVAWVSELKSTLSGVFYLLAILFFVKMLRANVTEQPVPHRRYCGWTLFFAALALVSKPSTVVLAPVLCLCSWWVEGRWEWRNLARVAPIFLMAGAASLVAVWSQTIHEGNEAWVRSWPERIAGSGEVIWFYLGKLIWPHPLINSYPEWNIDADSWSSYLPLLGVIVVLVALGVGRESWRRPWFFAFVYYILALTPVLGLVTISSNARSLVDDHLQYLADMGPLALLGAGLARFSERPLPGLAWLPPGLCLGVLLGLGAMSWHRAGAFKSEESIWTDTLAKNPTCRVGHNNLGVAFFHEGRLDDAMAEYQKALQIEPGDAETHRNKGEALYRLGRVDAAKGEFEKSLTIDPDRAETHIALGLVLSRQGQEAGAIDQYREAVRIDSTDADAHYNLGVALSQAGRENEAIAEYEKAIQLDPRSSAAHYNLGRALARKQELPEASEEFKLVLQMDPKDVDACVYLGAILAQMGRDDEAIAYFQKATLLDPKNVEAHDNWGITLLMMGKKDEAAAQFQEALRIDPSYAPVRKNLDDLKSGIPSLPGH